MSRRRPRRIFRDGTEPDPRFSLANERTFLAWIRTALALMAAGVALVAFELPLDAIATLVGACVLVGLGVLASAAGWAGWTRNERALRHQQPLPGPPAAMLVTVGVALVGLLVVLGLTLEGLA